MATKQNTVEWFTELVEEALWEQDEDGRHIANFVTYEDSGLLTRDKGFVVKLEDGTEIQVTLQVFNKHGQYADDSDGEDDEEVPA